MYGQGVLLRVVLTEGDEREGGVSRATKGADTRTKLRENVEARGGAR